MVSYYSFHVQVLPEGLMSKCDSTSLLPMRLYDLSVLDDTPLSADMCDGATVHVLPAAHTFAVLGDGRLAQYTCYFFDKTETLSMFN